MTGALHTGDKTLETEPNRREFELKISVTVFLRAVGHTITRGVSCLSEQIVIKLTSFHFDYC